MYLVQLRIAPQNPKTPLNNKNKMKPYETDTSAVITPQKPRTVQSPKEKKDIFTKIKELSQR